MAGLVLELGLVVQGLVVVAVVQVALAVEELDSVVALGRIAKQIELDIVVRFAQLHIVLADTE